MLVCAATFSTFAAGAQAGDLNVQSETISGEVKIYFRGFKDREGYIYAEFAAVNESSQPATYIGYEEGAFASDRVFFDDVEEPLLGMCGTGLLPYSLAPGASIIHEVPIGRFKKNSQKNGEFQVGLSLSVKNSKQT